MLEPFFKEEFPSCFDAMVEIIDQAVEALRREGWVFSDHESCMRLCLEEALVNAISHGNEGDIQRKVRLEMYGYDRECRIKVFDEGQGFKPEDVSMPAVEQLGGRGVFTNYVL